MFWNSSVFCKTRDEWQASLYLRTQDADATLVNLLDFGSNRNLLGAKKHSGSFPGYARVLRAGVTGRTRGT